MEADGDLPQLWFPPTTHLIPVRRHHSRTFPILKPEALILAIPILVLLIIFLILPPFLSYTNHQILKPSSVKKGWDSITIFLVLIAVLCGVFAKRNDDKSSSLNAGQKNLDAGTNVSDDNIRKFNRSSEWLDFPCKSEYDKMTSSRSYPDLRQESMWGCESNEFKSFDDFEVNFHQQPEKRQHRERRSQKVEKEAVAEPAPPPQPVQRRRSVHRGRNDNENKSLPPPPAALSLPLPPPEPEFLAVAERIQREKSGTTKEIATAIASLQYGTQTQRKKKVKSRDIYESATQDLLPPSAIAPPSTSPPPPPPPPSKGIQSLLKKSSKSKCVHSVSTTAQPPPPQPNSIFANIFKAGSKSNRSQLSSASSHPPPPPPPVPPPPHSIFNNIFSSGSKSKRCQIPSVSSQPPPPKHSPPTSSILISSFDNLTKTQRFKNSDTPNPPLPPPKKPPVYTGKPPKPPKPSTSSHNELDIIVAPSPLIPMPPPPPSPPFRMPEINFVPKGDFARKGSMNSSQRSSTKLEDVDVMSIESESGQSIRPSISCPSPDVNIKADTFISRLRDGWRLEKLNSINERQNSVSTSNRL